MVLLAALSVAACDGGVGVDGPVNATLAFQASQATGAAASPASVGPAGSAARTSSGPARAIALEGNNGTLVLDEVYMIVSEVELDSDDCDDDDFDDNDGDDSDGFGCGDFEAGPRLVALPLDGSPVTAFEGMIAAGRYDELEFEVEDLEDDDDDDWQEIGALRDEILDLIPDWPRRASLYVAGTFQRDGEDPVAFRTFVDAEIEVELELNPPLVVGDDGIDDPLLVVDVRPDLWFRDGQGGYIDLTEWDYDATGHVLELEVEIEDGFAEVEFDDD